MVRLLTDQGVEIDYCADCKGIWLDKGEIFYFTKKPRQIQKELDEAIKRGKPSERICPRTGESMRQIKLLNGKLTLDYSPGSGGIWFDGVELEKLITHFGDEFKLRFDRGTVPLEEKIPSVPVSLAALPNLVVRSGAVLVFLYGLLTVILITLTLYTDLTPLFALIIGVVIATIQFVFGPYLTDISLRWFYNMSWVNYEELPTSLTNYAKQCKNCHNPGTYGSVTG
jgi:Zn-finger nucleic acid-binding protein